MIHRKPVLLDPNFLRVIFIAILLVSSMHTNAQSYVDSLKQVLASEKEDTTRVMLLLDIGSEYLNSKPDTDLILTLQSLALARQIKYVVGELHSLNTLGNIFMVTGNYPKSLENFLEALKLSEKMGDQRKIAIVSSNIGLLYAYQDDHKMALPYYLKAKIIAQELKDDDVLNMALINIGDSYEKLNQLDSALTYTLMAYKISSSLNDIDSRGITLNNLGNIHSKMGNATIAMNYYRQSIRDFIEENDDEGICEDALGMARLFKKSGIRDSLLYYARLSIEAATRGGFTKSLLNATDFLAEYYEGIHRLDSAYVYLKIATTAKDSLFNQEKSKALQNLVFAEKTRQQEILAAKELAITTRKKNIQMAGIGVFIPVFFGMVLLFKRSKTKPKTIEFLGMLGLLMVFEFISILMGPFIGQWTNNAPVFTLLVQMTIASSLVPLHDLLEYWVKEKLVLSTE